MKRIFSWLICTRQPLRIVELEHALLIQSGDKDFQHLRALFKDIYTGTLWSNRGEERGVYHLCSFFSQRVKSPNIYRVVAYNTDPTFSRYLTKDLANDSHGIRKAESHAEVAMACLSYLYFRYFDSDMTDEVDGCVNRGGY